MKRIPLGGNRRGYEPRGYALVDDADYEALAVFSWHRHGAGYAARNERRPDGSKRLVLMHRQLFGLEPGDPREVDHENGNRADNQRSNLRIVTKAQQRENVRPYGRSGIRGVRQVGRRWQARCGSTYLGQFDTAEEAAAVAADFRREHMPYSIDRPKEQAA